MCATCNQRFTKTMDKINISTKSTRSSSTNIVGNFSEVEIRYTFTWMTELLEMEAVKCNYGQKKHKLLPHLKIIAGPVCGRIAPRFNGFLAISYLRPHGPPSPNSGFGSTLGPN